MTLCSCESRKTDTTKTFTGKSSLTGSIAQTWAATTGILLGEKVEISSIRLNFKVYERILVVEAGCKKFQIHIERLPHTAANRKLEGVQRTTENKDFNWKTLILQISTARFLLLTASN